MKKACEEQGRDPGSLVCSAAVNVDIRANSADKVVDELSQFKEAGAQRLYMQLLDTADAEQVSIIANANNTNRSNYGSSSFSISNAQSSLGGGGTGFNDTKTGGFNFSNVFSKKLTLSSSYFWGV